MGETGCAGKTVVMYAGLNRVRALGAVGRCIYGGAVSQLRVVAEMQHVR